MLSKLIDESRTQTIYQVQDWQEAIRIASQPLLDQNCIEESYINKMINAVNQHGPYIILADRFALPHASNTGEVNELSMSLLRVNKDVDFLGQPVSTFMVLAAIDSNSHLGALTSLAELLYDEENLKTFTTKSTDEIMSLIRSKDKDRKEESL